MLRNCIIFSLALHAAALIYCPMPEKPVGEDSGTAEMITVHGVVSLLPTAERKMEIPEPAVERLTEPKVSIPREPEVEPPEPVMPEIEPEVTQEETGSEDLSAGESASLRTLYLQSVIRKLEKAKRYPSVAYRRSIEGSAEIGFTVRADGTVQDARLLRSSGSRVLDKASLDMVDRAAPFDPVPQELGVDELEITIPTKFTITD